MIKDFWTNSLTKKGRIIVGVSLAALILVMVFFGVSHDGFEGLNK